MNVHNYYVYLMTNEWRNVLYTGVTKSLERRVWQHKQGVIKGFTRQYNCRLLVHMENYLQISDAIAREKQIKGWSRAKKNALVESTNPKWQDLGATWYAASGFASVIQSRRSPGGGWVAAGAEHGEGSPATPHPGAVTRR